MPFPEEQYREATVKAQGNFRRGLSGFGQSGKSMETLREELAFWKRKTPSPTQSAVDFRGLPVNPEPWRPEEVLIQNFTTNYYQTDSKRQTFYGAASAEDMRRGAGDRPQTDGGR